MNKDRRVIVMALVAVAVSVLGISVGFAAFSQSLTIKSSAEVSPNGDNFDIVFSTKEDTVSTDPVIPTVIGDGASATNAIIDGDNNNLSIKNIHAIFTEPGQKAVYKFYSKNSGKYNAFLNAIAYANVSGKNESKVCNPRYTTGEDAATNSLVQAACDDIKITVSAGGILYPESVANITDHPLVVDASEEIVLTIEYVSLGDRADGPFDIQFGDITLAYNSVD